MGARHKLNQFHVSVSLFLAAAFGYLTGSWLVFSVALAILIGVNLHSGAIRPDRKNR
jgi:hypothetical protein